MLLRFFGNLPPRDVARRLQVPVETVRTRIKRALAMLRARLDSLHGGDRRAWCVMLVPLIPFRTPAAVAISSVGGTLTGMLIMTTKTKLAAVAAICGLILATLWATEWPIADDGLPPAAEPDSGRMVAESEGKRTLDATGTKDRQDQEERIEPRQPLPAPTLGSLLVRAIWGDDKKPAAGVMLQAKRVNGDFLFDTVGVTTDAAGTCVLESLKPGRMYVEAVRNRRAINMRITIVAGTQTEATLEIPPGVNLKGIVVDKAGDPVAGADVVVADWGGRLATAIAKTEGDGRFDLRSIGTHCSVGARAAGHAPSFLHTIIGSKGGNLTLRLSLTGRGGALRGKVLDPRGEAVAGAVIEVGEWKRGSMIRLPDGGRGMAMLPIRVRSDRDGRFLVEGLAPGKTPVAVRALRLAPWSGEAEVLTDGSSELVVHLLPGVTLTGTVRDGNTKPVEKVSVSVNNYGQLSYQRVVTDAAGKYRLEGLPIGKLTLRARNDKIGRVQTELEAVAGQKLVWDPVISKGLVLRGRVLDHNNKPVYRAMVEAHPEQSTGKINWWAFEPTDKEGRFELKNCVPDKTIWIRVEGGRGHGNKRLEGIKPGHEELVIRLPAGSKPSIFITGRVLDPDGKPVEACSISPYSKEDRGGAVLITEAGTGAFKYGPYVPGEWQLRIDAKGYPVARTVWRKVEKGETWDLGAIRLQSGGFLRANFKAADGQLPEKLTLRILDAARQFLTRLRVEGSSGRSAPLAPGTYYLQVRGESLATEMHRFEIQAGQDTPLSVTLHQGVPVALEIVVQTDMGEQPPQRRVTVTVVDSAGKTVLSANAYRRRGANVAVLRFATRSGKYRVKASTEGGKSVATTIEVGTKRGEPVRLVLR